MDDLGQEIMKAKVIFAMRGYGWLTLTTNALYWNKSATTYLALGIMGALSDDHLLIPFERIAKVDTYKAFSTLGIMITTKNGREFKMGFKHKKEFQPFYDNLMFYLNQSRQVQSE